MAYRDFKQCYAKCKISLAQPKSSFLTKSGEGYHFGNTLTLQLVGSFIQAKILLQFCFLIRKQRDNNGNLSASIYSPANHSL